MFGISLLLTRGRLEISSLTVSVGCSVNPALLSSSTHCFGVLRSEHVLVTLHLYRGVPAICEIPCLPATLGIHNVSHWQHYGIRPHYSLHLLSCMDFLSPVLGFADIQLGSVQGCNGHSIGCSYLHPHCFNGTHKCGCVALYFLLLLFFLMLYCQDIIGSRLRNAAAQPSLCNNGAMGLEWCPWRPDTVFQVQFCHRFI